MTLVWLVEYTRTYVYRTKLEPNADHYFSFARYSHLTRWKDRSTPFKIESSDTTRRTMVGSFFSLDILRNSDKNVNEASEMIEMWKYWFTVYSVQELKVNFSLNKSHQPIGATRKAATIENEFSQITRIDHTNKSNLPVEKLLTTGTDRWVVNCFTVNNIFESISYNGVNLRTKLRCIINVRPIIRLLK